MCSSRTSLRARLQSWGWTHRRSLGGSPAWLPAMFRAMGRIDSLVPLVVVAWLIVGAVLCCYYRARSPEKIAAIGSFVPDGNVRQDGPRESRPDMLAAGERNPAAIEATANHP
jgi:hypothetical protein